MFTRRREINASYADMLAAERRVLAHGRGLPAVKADKGMGIRKALVSAARTVARCLG